MKTKNKQTNKTQTTTTKNVTQIVHFSLSIFDEDFFLKISFLTVLSETFFETFNWINKLNKQKNKKKCRWIYISTMLVKDEITATNKNISSIKPDSQQRVRILRDKCS